MNMRMLLIALLAIVAVGCESGGSGPMNTNDDAEVADTDDQADDQTEDDSAEAYFPLPEQAGERRDSEELSFRTQTVIEGLASPWGMAFLPDGIVLITEREGSLRLVRDGELDPASISGTPAVFSRGQGGLLDVTAHPDYADNGWIYLSFSDPSDGAAHTALMRARLNIDERRLVDQEALFSGQPKTDATRHFGSRVVLQEGYVFVSSGDRADPDEAQNLASHHGSVIRLHDDGRIPDDNPFVNEPDAQPETWSYGHRNIQGMTLHPVTNELWSHEHGPQGGDEINIIRGGGNYGWPEVTHGTAYDGSEISDRTEQEGMESPLTHWTPSIAPSGMAFVNGDQYPQWQHNIMVGALAAQELRRVVVDGEEVVHEETLLQGLGRIRDVEMAPDGYLYLINESSGSIVRLIPDDE